MNSQPGVCHIFASTFWYKKKIYFVDSSILNLELYWQRRPLFIVLGVHKFDVIFTYLQSFSCSQSRSNVHKEHVEVKISSILDVELQGSCLCSC